MKCDRRNALLRNQTTVLYNTSVAQQTTAATTSYIPHRYHPTRTYHYCTTHPPLKVNANLFAVFAQLARIAVRCLAVAPRHVLVLDHMRDLPLHGDVEQHQEVQHQDRPEDGDVAHTEECHHQGDDHGFRATCPEFELGKAPGKRPELFSVPRGEA